MDPLILLKILVPPIVTFFIGLAITPPVMKWLYANKIWKKKNVTKTIDGKEAVYSAKLHNDEAVKTPRMGGLIIWISVIATASLFYFLNRVVDLSGFARFDFVSRSQTWLPLAALLFGGVLGAIDDLSVVEYFKKSGTYIGGGLSLRVRLFFVFLISLFVAYWFVVKLGMSQIDIPFFGLLTLSPILFGALVVIVMVATYAGGVIDGVDGLSGGVMSTIFGAYGVIALLSHQYDMATLCFVVVSGILAFLWFNIPPARFYNTETGMTGLLLSIVVIAFLVGGVAYLPVIAFLLYATVASVILQLLSKKFFNRKLLLVAPIHHHFEAKGMANYTVAMRYWIVGTICAIAGIALSLV